MADYTITLSDALDENGLTVATSNEILTQLTNALTAIYGSDIVLDSNTADGQKLNIDTQMNVDFRELVQEIYNSFDPDKCRGTIQDVRFGLNGIQRAGGTFTIVPITITLDRTITLEGLDDNYNDVTATSYGVQDNNGNIYYLITTQTLLAGTHVLSFRYKNVGYNLPTIGTITSQVTVVQGVTNVNNASAPTTVGVNQETDEAFALRRSKSYEYKSQNSADAMMAQLEALTGVNEAYVYQHDIDNYPSSPDADGIPVNYIWPIVEGGSSADIATVIYANADGRGMVGAKSVDLVSSAGQTFTVHYDEVTNVDLHIRFDIQKTVSSFVFDQPSIKEYISENLIFVTNEYADTSKVTAAALIALTANGGGGVPVNAEISLDGSTWVDYITSSSKKNKFTVSTANITITELGAST